MLSTAEMAETPVTTVTVTAKTKGTKLDESAERERRRSPPSVHSAQAPHENTTQLNDWMV